EANPADVFAPGVARQVSHAVVLHAVVARRGARAVVRAVHVDPADVLAVHVAGELRTGHLNPWPAVTGRLGVDPADVLRIGELRIVVVGIDRFGEYYAPDCRDGTDRCCYWYCS